MNKLGGGRFAAYSAGSQPKGDVHPMAIELLGDFGFATDGLRSKSWDEFTRPGAPEFDFIFTVCDNAAGESARSSRARRLPRIGAWKIPPPLKVKVSARHFWMRWATSSAGLICS